MLETNWKADIETRVVLRGSFSIIYSLYIGTDSPSELIIPGFLAEKGCLKKRSLIPRRGT